MRVLITGATGYIGGRLVPRLLGLGHDVAVLVRDQSRFAGRPGSDQVQVIEGDLLSLEPNDDRLRGFDATYYLVHSITSGRGFEQRERQAAANFANAIGGCPHVIYLGGLLPKEGASEHLSSRAATGQVLAEHLSGRITEFRAGPIIGSGSASFEMVRYLTERLPVMVTPRWVRNMVQPIAIRDVLSYLIEALDVNPQGVMDIGADQLTFADMMQGYAAERGLPRRVILPTPFLAPTLAARWVGFVTPISNRLAVPLVAGVTQSILADTGKAQAVFPHITLFSYREAVARALQRIGKNLVETRWSGSLGDQAGYAMEDQEGLIREVRQVEANTSADAVFNAFTRLGGERGWLCWNWAWAIRGGMDKLVGGPGLRRGRRDPQELHEGEALDFWRVEKVERPNLLRLRAEMKVPGLAWLQFETSPGEQPGTTRLTQTALFEPKGLLGFIYWYAFYPAHLFIFSDMARAIARDAELADTPGTAR